MKVSFYFHSIDGSVGRLFDECILFFIVQTLVKISTDKKDVFIKEGWDQELIRKVCTFFGN